MKDYSWVTDEMFDRMLVDILDDTDSSEILAIPGVYDLVKEYFNNEVLEQLEEEREDLKENSAL